MSFTDIFKKIFGTKADRDMKAIKPMLDKVLEAYKSIDQLSDDELRARCTALKAKIQAAIAADEARIAQIKEENERILSNIAELEATAVSLRETSVKTKEKIENLTEKRTQGEARSTSLRAKEREMSNEREKLGGELARLEERRDAMQRELETAQNKLYDEYQLSLREATEMNIVLDDIPKAQRTLQEIKNKIRALSFSASSSSI